MHNVLSALIISCVILSWQPTFCQQRVLKPRYTADSLTILPPGVETYYRTGPTISKPDYELRDKVYQRVVKQVKLMLPKSEFIDLEIMHKDYRTVNHLIESKYGLLMKSNEEIDVPFELITKKSKYALLLSTGGNSGFSGRSYFLISIINNETKKFEYFESIFVEDIGINNLRNVSRVFSKLIKRIIKY